MHTQRADSQHSAAKRLNGFSNNLLSLSEIILFSLDNISLYPLTQYQEVKLKTLLWQIAMICGDINLVGHEP